MNWIAKLLGRKRVYLLDHDGEITRTWAKPTPAGLTCRRLGRHCLLLDGGVVVGPIFVERWYPG